MMQQNIEYEFPEKLAFRAREVTNPEFVIQISEEWIQKLWVDFSHVRDESLFARLEYRIGVLDSKVEFFPGNYAKVIFSGHRGCGKSVELRRLNNRLNKPEAFFTVFVDLEKEMSIERFQPEDLFVALIAILLRTLDERGVKYDGSEFEAIAKEWVSETEVSNEIAKSFGVEAGVEASLGFQFLKFIGIGGHLKGTYSADNKTTKAIRQQIKTNPMGLITRLNAAIVGLRAAIIAAKLGQEILFIVDGLEKTNRTVYESLFIQDPQAILSLAAHQILTVPIGTFYEIQSQPSREFFDTFYLPMLRLSPSTIPLFKDLVLRRVDSNLLEAGVLDRCIEYSGGCPRQMLKLINRALGIALGKPVTLEHADKAIREEGNERWRTLTSAHQEILRSQQFETANKEVLELLQSLNILEYNGMNLERKINPLIARFFTAEA